MRDVARLRTAGRAVVAAWALALPLAEGLLQVAAGVALALGLALRAAGHVRLAPDVRAYVRASLALAAWQLVSPAVALATGAAERWPRGARYGQVLDTLGATAVAVVGAGAGVAWGLVAALAAGAWVAAAALGLFQHLVRWPWEPPAFTKLSLARLHENFGTEEAPRYSAGGFHFHRLRFSHGAVAALGPALVLALRGRGTRRALAAGVALALLVSPYLAFARAALLVGLGLVVGALLLLARGRVRAAGLALAALGVAVMLATPGWRTRLVLAVGNLAGGERTVAMSAGLELALAHPVLGVGFGNHQRAALALGHEHLTAFLANDAHNLWLTVWAETGLVGVALLLLAHVLLARALWRRHCAGSPAATGALLGFAAFHVLSLVHYLPFHPSVHLSFGLLWGLGLCEGSETLLRARHDGPVEP